MHFGDLHGGLLEILIRSRYLRCICGAGEYERSQYVQSLVLHTSDYETAFGSRSMAEAPSGSGTGPFTT